MSPHKAAGLFAGEVLCGSCGRYNPFHRCKLISKGKNTWRCGVCAVKSVQLWRGLGSWPSEGFLTLSQADRQDFMKSLDGCDGPASVAKARETFEGYESHSEFYSDGGKFLPLEVWARKGYDPEAIRTKSLPQD
jgi:hypothetical protein